ncbi:MAG TPA: hypothetical protein VN894_18645 [Polyangiaceae bacterium]|nr:hypothetical protein [Polyangiaceae bacterium]
MLGEHHLRRILREYVGYYNRPGYFADPPKTPPGAALCSRTLFAVVTVIAAALVDLFRSRRSLLTAIALLRHQLTVLERSVARPHVTRLDRIGGLHHDYRRVA